MEPAQDFSGGTRPAPPGGAPASRGASERPAAPEAAGRESLFGRLFGTRRPGEGAGSAAAASPLGASGPGIRGPMVMNHDASAAGREPADARPSPASPPAVGPVLPVEARPAPVSRDPLGRDESGDRAGAGLTSGLQSGFQDMSRLLSAIKETLQSRDGQVQQTLQALPGFLQQVPKIHRAEIECLAQISKQLEHMGTGTRDVLARLDAVPDLLRGLALAHQEQARFLDGLQARMAESLEGQAKALQEGLETSRRNAETQLQMIRGLAQTQEDIFSTFQNTQNRALNVFHRAQQQAHHQHRETQQVLGKQVEMLVEKVHVAQTRVFWLSIGFAALAAAGFVAVLLFG